MPAAATRSTVLRWHAANPRAEVGDVGAFVFQLAPLGRRGTLCQPAARAPFSLWTDRARHKAAAAIRADVGQHVLNAFGAERALIAADAGIGRVRRQILVAVFAIRSEFEHFGCFLKRLTRGSR